MSQLNLLLSNDQNKKKYSIQECERKLKQLEWKNGIFEKQSWGHSLHRVGPYVGRIKPSFAHFILRYFTNEDDVVLDPFCGIGTFCLEAALLGRESIGCDINPYALKIAKSKTQVNLNVEKLIRVIDKAPINKESIDLKSIPEWVKEYYNLETLKEILSLLEYFKKNRHHYIYGCLLAISQGHRVGHLSKPSAWTLPFKPRPDDPGEYREVKPRLIAKVKRNLKDGSLEKKLLEIRKCDATKLKLEKNSIDKIVSSPPYFNTLDYINSHRLRLAIMGVHDERDKKNLKKKTIQHFQTYLEDMEKVIIKLNYVLKKGGRCCFVVGDHFTPKKDINTAKELSKIFERNGFKSLFNIKDPIPVNKSIQKKTTKIKYERIIAFEKK